MTESCAGCSLLRPGTQSLSTVKTRPQRVGAACGVSSPSLPHPLRRRQLPLAHHCGSGAYGVFGACAPRPCSLSPSTSPASPRSPLRLRCLRCFRCLCPSPLLSFTFDVSSFPSLTTAAPVLTVFSVLVPLAPALFHLRRLLR